MKDLTELESADAYCRLLVRRHYENFVVVSSLIRGRIAVDLARIYAYCRTTDDLGDESGDEALDRLQQWRGEVDSVFCGHSPVHPVLIALRATVAQHRMSSKPFLDLIEANIQDQHVKSYGSWPALRAYCDLSAAPVGRMVLSAFGVHSAQADALSDDVCVGLQLANHAQDVARDAARGRCYLLQPDITTGGTAFAVRSLCDRARALLSSGEELERMVPFALRVQLALYRLGGLAICDAIAREAFATDRVRPQVSKLVKAGLLVRACLQSLFESRDARKLETA